MKDFTLLYRRGFNSPRDDEYETAKSIFKDKLVTQRTQILPNSTIIGRYSVLPFYKEL